MELAFCANCVLPHRPQTEILQAVGARPEKGTSAEMPHGENFLRARQSRDAHTHTPIPSTQPPHPRTHMCWRCQPLDAPFSLPPVAPSQQDRRKASTASLRTGTGSLLPQGLPLVDAVRPTHPATGIARWRWLAWARGRPVGPRVMASPGSDSPSPLGMTGQASCVLIRYPPAATGQAGQGRQHLLVALAALAALFVVRPSHPSAFACRAVGQCQQARHPIPNHARHDG